MNKVFSHRFYPWIIIFLSAFLIFYKYIIQVYPGLITDVLMHHFHLLDNPNGGLIMGGMVASTLYTIVIGQMIAGYMTDRYGLRLVGSVSLLLAGLGLVLFANCEEIWIAYTARIMMGLGISSATVCYIKAVVEWFPVERFAFVSSFLATAAMTGAIVGEAPLSVLFSWTGWQEGLIICGIIGIFFSGVYLVFVRSGVKHSNHRNHKAKIKWVDVKNALWNRNNIFLALYSGLIFTPVDAFAGLWGNHYLRMLYDMDRTQAAGLISMIFFGMAIGSPFIGMLADRTGCRKLIIMMALSIAIIALMMAFYIKMPHWMLGSTLFVFGFACSSLMLAFAIGRMNNPVVVVGIVVALINTGEPILGGIFDMMVGWVLDMLSSGANLVNGVHVYTIGQYQKAFLLLPVSLMIAFVLVLFIKDKGLPQTQEVREVQA